MYSYKCSRYCPFNNFVNIKFYRLNNPSNCTEFKSCTIRKKSKNNDICNEGIIHLDWIDFIKFNTIFNDEEKINIE